MSSPDPHCVRSQYRPCRGPMCRPGLSSDCEQDPWQTVGLFFTGEKTPLSLTPPEDSRSSQGRWDTDIRKYLHRACVPLGETLERGEGV